jgi:TDG/mug DNA glycosylase family protein
VRVLFVGINPGTRSAAVGHHFAGYSNRFWKLLYESGLAPTRLTYEDDRCLPEWGFGITNIVARPSPGIHALKPRDYAAGRRKLLVKIRRYRPKVVVLLGVTLRPILFPKVQIHRTRTTTPDGGRIGLQPEPLAGAKVFVLPNPSGRNAHYSYQAMLEAYRTLRDYLESAGR